MKFTYDQEAAAFLARFELDEQEVAETSTPISRRVPSSAVRTSMFACANSAKLTPDRRHDLWEPMLGAPG